MKIKKARLIEESLSYEQLVQLEIFSEDEISYDLKRKIIKERKEKNALKKSIVM
jgi:hypothetical protein